MQYSLEESFRVRGDEVAGYISYSLMTERAPGVGGSERGQEIERCGAGREFHFDVQARTVKDEMKMKLVAKTMRLYGKIYRREVNLVSVNRGRTCGHHQPDKLSRCYDGWVGEVDTGTVGLHTTDREKPKTSWPTNNRCTLQLLTCLYL